MIGIHVVPPSVEFLTPKYIPNWAEAFQSIIEAAGRNCYQSEPKGNDTAERFIKRHLRHESIIEHGVFTVKFIGSRTMSHQLVRHRIAAYSQESQRFCDYASDRLQENIDETPEESIVSGGKFLKVILPPSIIPTISVLPFSELKTYTTCGSVIPLMRLSDGSDMTLASFAQEQWGFSEDAAFALSRWCMGRICAYEEYLQWRARGVPAEDARSCLPNATKTSVVTTYDFRMWRHVLGHPVFGRALNSHAQWEIKHLMLAVLEYFEQHVPAMFGDLREQLTRPDA